MHDNEFTGRLDFNQHANVEETGDHATGAVRALANEDVCCSQSMLIFSYLIVNKPLFSLLSPISLEFVVCPRAGLESNATARQTRIFAVP